MSLPAAPGVGYKPQHFTDLMSHPSPVRWIEIHAENYMGDGGRPLAQLRALAERFPVSVHGVALSLGGAAPLDRDHLKRLRHLLDWLQPAQFSEHLAWSTHDDLFLNDLLPVPYTAQTLAKVVDHIDQAQEALGRQILLENPSSYLRFDASEMSEQEFIQQIAHRTGCGLLLDVNNVFVSAHNLGFSPRQYIDEYPTQHVREIHVAGHAHDHDDAGNPLLIDSHGAPTSEPVWELLDYALCQTGPQPILVEWDNDVPDWATLRAETIRAEQALLIDA